MIYRTDEELAAALATWQPRLLLVDWEISARLVDARELDKCGDCAVSNNWNAAEIRLARHDTITQPMLGMLDMERTLVHELLHCVFRSRDLWCGSAKATEDRAYERAIEQTARALVAIARNHS